MKKKKKKAFTLVELLAVIVILAVILLIAVPAVKKTIDSAKKKTAENDAVMIKNIAEKYYTANLESDEELTGIDLTSNTLSYSGEKPSKGYLYFTEDGIAYGKMYLNGYCVELTSSGESTSTKVKETECDIENIPSTPDTPDTPEVTKYNITFTTTISGTWTITNTKDTSEKYTWNPSTSSSYKIQKPNGTYSFSYYNSTANCTYTESVTINNSNKSISLYCEQSGGYDGHSGGNSQ